jgi:predicted HAD superfamily Cof-like phosphohydrolase
MDETLSNVKAFHDAFEIETLSTPQITEVRDPVVKELLGNFADRMEQLAEQLHKAAEICKKNTPLLRLQLMQEELAELARAMANDDIVEAFDALVDLRYVNDGTVLVLGLGNVFMEGFREAQRSNMSKLVDGKPIKNEAGRVMKGENYSPPNMAKILEGVKQSEGE